MKTLKKTLCLVLAVVMVVGVLILPASATDYVDDAEITHKEAVTVLTKLGILTGDEGFRPGDTLTRAEAAAVISRLALTPTVADRYPKGQTGFADVDVDKVANWASGYIAYCASQNIVGGDGVGFAPNDNVTGTEFAKMLLCAVGYDAEIEGFGGKLWSINVIGKALEVELDKGIEDFDYDADLTRDDMAQMTYNTLLNLGAVTYKDGEATVGANTLKAKHKVTVNDGLTSDEYKRPESYSVKVNGEKVYNTYANAVGSEYKDTVTVKKIFTDDLKLTGNVYVKHYVDGVRKYVGNEIDNLDSNPAGTVAATATTPISYSGKGAVTSVYKTTEKIDNKDTDVYLVITITSQLHLVAAASEITAKGVKIVDNAGDDNDQYYTGEVAVGDVIIFHAGAGKVTEATLASHKPGKVTSKTANYIRIDNGGETYYAAKTVAGTVTAANANFTATYDVYTDANGYIVYMKVAETEPDPETEPTYVYVLRYEANEGKVAVPGDTSGLIPGAGQEAKLPVIKAEVLDLATGAVTVYDVAYGLNEKKDGYVYLKTDGKPGTTPVATVKVNEPGDMVGFKKITVLEDKTIVLEPAAAANVKAVTIAVDGKANIGTDMYADANTVLNLITPKRETGKATTYTVKSYTGYKSFKAIENDATLTNALVLFTQKDGKDTNTAKTVYLFGTEKAAPTTPAPTTNYYFIYVSAGEQSATGISYKFIYNGEEITYTTDGEKLANGISAEPGTILTLTFDDAGRITGATPVLTSSATGTIASANSDYIVSGANIYYLTANVVVYDGRTTGDTKGTVLTVDKLAANMRIDLYYATSENNTYSLVVIRDPAVG